jgi:hypothetical protein
MGLSGRVSWLTIDCSCRYFALLLSGDADHLGVLNTGNKAEACNVSAPSTITNSLCESTGRRGIGLYTFASDDTPHAVEDHFRNVTAIGAGPHSVGVLAYVDYYDSLTVNLVDTIASGTAYDVNAATENDTGSANITLSYSDYVTARYGYSPGPTAITDAGENVHTPALFRDPANLDYEEARRSPTVDAGEPQAPHGQDLLGHPRVQGPEPDIGAYEFAEATG